MRDKITNMEDIILSSFSNKVIALRKENEDLYDDVPDELCDPIMSTLIEEPVMLPDTNIIMDKSVIARHLISDPHNPFNRSELTMDEIEEFNSKEDIYEFFK